MSINEKKSLKEIPKAISAQLELCLNPCELEVRKYLDLKLGTKILKNEIDNVKVCLDKLNVPKEDYKHLLKFNPSYTLLLWYRSTLANFILPEKIEYHYNGIDNRVRNLHKHSKIRYFDSKGNFIAPKRTKQFLEDYPDVVPFIMTEKLTCNVISGLKTILGKKAKRREIRFFDGYEWDEMFFIWDIIQSKKQFMIKPEVWAQSNEVESAILGKGFVHIPRERFKNVISNYRRYLDLLVKSKMLERTLGVSKYGGPKWYYKIQNKFLKYRCVSEVITNESIIKQYHKIRHLELEKILEDEYLVAQLLTYPRLTLPADDALMKLKNLAKDRFNSKGQKLRFIKSDTPRSTQVNIRKNKSFSIMNDHIDELHRYRDQPYKWKLPSYSRKEMASETLGNTRIYNVISSMPAWLRKGLLIDGELVLEVDACAMHIAELYTFGLEQNWVPIEELELFKIDAMSEGGMHTVVAETLGISRPEVKIHHLSFFNAYINQWEKDDGYKKIKAFYSTRYPKLFRAIEILKEKTPKKMSRFFMEVESSVMNPIPTKVSSLSIFDGIICKESEAERVLKIMKEQLQLNEVPTTASKK